MAVLLETTLGDIVIDLYVKERPKCKTDYSIQSNDVNEYLGCLNFLKLCKMKFYNLCQFYHIDVSYFVERDKMRNCK